VATTQGSVLRSTKVRNIPHSRDDGHSYYYGWEARHDAAVHIAPHLQLRKTAPSLSMEVQLVMQLGWAHKLAGTLYAAARLCE
jgi:hypothetical protein